MERSGMGIDSGNFVYGPSINLMNPVGYSWAEILSLYKNPL